MYLTGISHFPSFSAFGVTKKSALPKNFDLIARSFDENILRCLKTLTSNSNRPSISLCWLSLAVEFLSSTHAEAQTLISNLKLAPLDDSLARYLDKSVKLLDVCNSISSEIERLRQRRLLINFVLHLLEPAGEGCKIPPPEKLRRARESLADWGNNSRGFTKRGFQTSMEVLMRDLAVDLRQAPGGKLSSVGKLVRRTIYATGLVTVFVSGVLASALFGLHELVSIRVPTEFLWADSFKDLESAIHGELKRRSGSETRPVLEELANVDSRIRGLRDVIDDVAGGDNDNKNKDKDALNNAVKETETVMESFTEGLERLCNGVNGVFRTVLCNRKCMLGNFRAGLEDRN